MSTEAVAAAASEPQQQVSDFGRVIGVLASPGATFADIVRKPKWIMPVLISTVLSIAFAYTMNQRIDWKVFIRQQIEKSPRGADIPPDRLSSIAETQAKWSYYGTYVGGVCGPVLFAVIMGGIYLLAFNVLGGAGIKFKTSLSVVAHAQMTGLVSAPMAMIVMWLRAYGDVDPQNRIATSLYAFLPGDAPRWLQSVGNSVELFWIWTMVLLAIGFAATNPKKVSTGKAFGIVLGLWLLVIFIKVSFAVMFG